MTSPSPNQVRDEFARQSLSQTYADLDRWRQRSTAIEMPEPGSDLDGDTAIWPRFPPHQVARVSLISGVQHLNLARVAIEERQTFPMAHPSVLRGALLGASRGVWLLSPDDRHERQQRALRTLYTNQHRLYQYLEAPVPGMDASEHQQRLAEVDSRRSGIKALWAASSTLTARQEPTETDTIDDAARFVFADTHQQDAVNLLWRQLSGDAHGLPWPVFTRASTVSQSRGRLPGHPTPMADYQTGADMFEIAEAFMAAFRILRRGWSLFDQRCEAP